MAEPMRRPERWRALGRTLRAEHGHTRDEAGNPQLRSRMRLRKRGSCLWSQDEPGALPPEHFEWRHEPYAKADTGIRNLDLPFGRRRNLVCNHRVFARLGLGDKVI